MHIAMQGGIFSFITDAIKWLVDLILSPIKEMFKALFDFIPKLMYLLYASLACLLDVLQLFFRKLAGLDIVYITDPITGEIHKTTGDLVTQFITGILGINEYGLQYSILSTVFWSFIIFGVIILFASTLVAIIKSHYNYDEKAAKGPMQYVYTAGRALVGMAIVPLTIVLGLYLSQALLTALDTFTSTSDSAIITLYGQENVSKYLFETYTARSFDDNPNSALKGEKSYIFYDIFGEGSGVWYGNKLQEDAYDEFYRGDVIKLTNVAATNATFSGSLFKAAAYNGNRARIYNWYSHGGYTGGPDDENFQLFKDAKGNEQLAEMIDTAFACNLHASRGHPIKLDYDNGEWLAWVSTSFFTQFLSMGSVAFSKFNVGLVWYYYDLWQFNFIIGFGSIIICFSIFLNVIMGLMARFFMCIVLFLIAPPLYGLMPLDNGQAAKNWRENFMKQVLMTYGAVVGMNLVMLILPYVNQIKFFNIGIADALATTLFIIVGLITIKAVIATLSSIIGAADANKTGEDMKQEVGGAIGGALKMTAGAAKFSTKVSQFNPVQRLAEKGIKSATMGWTDRKGNTHSGILRKSDGSGGFEDRAVIGGLKKAGGAVKGAWNNPNSKLSKVRDFVYGTGIKDKQRLKGFEEQQKIDSLIESVKGQKAKAFDRDAFEVQARQAGLSDSRAAALANEMQSKAYSLGAAGWNKAAFDSVKTKFESVDARYNSLRTANGRNAVDFDTNRRAVQASVDRRKNSAFNKATGTWQDANPFKWVNDNMLSADKGAAAVRDAIKKPTDQQKRSAEAAEENLKLTKKMLDKLDEIAKKK